ncbi:MAG: hypothetical protein IPF97_06380 [Sphingomonadales bacterium]|nr:hypothetical protein [Sphingomonadales bacterium]
MRALFVLALASSTILSSPALADDETADGSSEIIVYGKGETRQVSRSKQADIEILAGNDRAQGIGKIAQCQFPVRRSLWGI